MSVCTNRIMLLLAGFALALLVGAQLGVAQGRRLEQERHQEIMAALRIAIPPKRQLSERVVMAMDHACDPVAIEASMTAKDVYEASTGLSGRDAGISPTYLAVNAWRAGGEAYRLAGCIAWWVWRAQP